MGEDLRTVEQIREDIEELLIVKVENVSYEHCRKTYETMADKHDNGIKLSEEYKRHEMLWCYNYIVKVFRVTK